MNHLLFLTDPSLAIKANYGTHRRKQTEKAYREINPFQPLKANCSPGPACQASSKGRFMGCKAISHRWVFPSPLHKRASQKQSLCPCSKFLTP